MLQKFSGLLSPERHRRPCVPEYARIRHTIYARRRVPGAPDVLVRVEVPVLLDGLLRLLVAGVHPVQDRGARGDVYVLERVAVAGDVKAAAALVGHVAARGVLILVLVVLGERRGGGRQHHRQHRGQQH